MPWVNPTSVVDPDNMWLNDENAIDGDTGTFATKTGGDYKHWLEAYHSGLLCSEIRIYALTTLGGGTVLIQVQYGGSWYEVFNDIPANGAYEEIAIGSTQILTGIRIRRETEFFELLVYVIQFGEKGFLASA